MKHHVSVRVESCQLDAEGDEQRTENAYEGTWYQQDSSDTLVYQEQGGIQTTLRWNPEEWRLFRRGADMEGFQTFRLGESRASDLTLQGSYLPLVTHTTRMNVTPTHHGRELQLEYTLHSGEDLIGNFTLIIQLTTHDEETTHG